MDFPGSIATCIVGGCLVTASVMGLSPVAPVGQVRGPQDPLLESYDFDAPDDQHRLPRALREISGLALAGTRLLAHDDERGIVHVLDPNRGTVTGQIRLGPGNVAGDFEGVASAYGKTFLITSGGTLVSFQGNAREGDEVPFLTVETGLDRICEVEGLSEMPGEARLLIACKTNLARPLWGALQLFHYDLDEGRLAPEPAVRIELRELEALGIDEIHPSGVAVHSTGRILVLAARERLVLELDATGAPLAWKKLPRKGHPQPEGIAFLADGRLVIADEGSGGRGRITVFSPGAGT